MRLCWRDIQVLLNVGNRHIVVHSTLSIWPILDEKMDMAKNSGSTSRPSCEQLGNWDESIFPTFYQRVHFIFHMSGSKRHTYNGPFKTCPKPRFICTQIFSHRCFLSLEKKDEWAIGDEDTLRGRGTLLIKVYYVHMSVFVSRLTIVFAIHFKFWKLFYKKLYKMQLSRFLIITYWYWPPPML